jgi:hypothetical protein
VLLFLLDWVGWLVGQFDRVDLGGGIWVEGFVCEYVCVSMCV